MKRFLCSWLFITAASTVSAQNLTVSVDVFTFINMLIQTPPGDNQEQPPASIESLWACVELSFTTDAGRELGFGIFARADRVALRTNYRFFSNADEQSGFFWGWFGHIEWRKMLWMYDDNNEVAVGWNYPFSADNVYHSVGLAAGVDVGLRIRMGAVGITPFIGAALPLFYCFGDLPPEQDRNYFWLQNIVIRAIDIGLRLDFFL